MKTTFRKQIIFVLAVFIIAAQTVGAVEKTKKYNETWPASSVESLKISNKFGEVKFKNDGGANVTIDVLVKAEASSDNKAQDVLDMINVTIKKSGSVITAETSIENNFRGNRKFSIDYVINVPAEKNLWVSNKYGNVIVNQLTGAGEFDIQYGNITAVGLKGKTTKVALAYGKGNIDETGNADINIKYSNIDLGTTGSLNINSAYSGIDLEKAADVKIDSKYDKLGFGELTSLVADSKYSQVKVGRISKKLQIGAGYGGIRVENIAPDFESISIINSYGQISLGLTNTSYSIDASCSYCGILYPESRFKGNRMKEDNRIQINGKIGNAGGGTVKIESRYGEIKLTE